MYEKYLEILKEEMILAEGCTEPTAIAYASALARKVLGEQPEKLVLELSGNMIKNVDSVVIPNSGGGYGVETAALLGMLYGDSDEELLVISNVNEEQIKEYKEKYLNKGVVEVKHLVTPVKLYINVEAFFGDESVSIEIKHVHTNITKIIKNNEVIYDEPCNDGDFNSPLEDRKFLNIKDIVEFSSTYKIEGEIKDLLDLLIEKNEKIAKEGLENPSGISVGATIRKNIEMGDYGNDVRNLSSSYAAAGSDARMSGCSLPVMTVAGSGNQGMTCSLSVIEFWRFKGLDKEELYRALTLSILATIHIKTNVGRLSAYCGVVCAAAAASGAFTYLLKGSQHEIENSIILSLGDQSGLLCDGAKSTCAKKIATTITSACDSAFIAKYGNCTGTVGFVDNSVEQTIENISRIAGEGLNQADEVVLDLILKSKIKK